MLGYLYNFAYGTRVYSYQWGIDYADAPRYQPGKVIELLAVERAAAAGYAVYDLLHGNTLYKRTMGTAMEPRYWLTLQRGRLDFFIENGLRRIKRVLTEPGS